MISIPGSLSFAKLVLCGECQIRIQDPLIQCRPIQSRIQSVLGERSFYFELNIKISCKILNLQ